MVSPMAASSVTLSSSGSSPRTKLRCTIFPAQGGTRRWNHLAPLVTDRLSRVYRLFCTRQVVMLASVDRRRRQGRSGLAAVPSTKSRVQALRLSLLQVAVATVSTATSSHLSISLRSFRSSLASPIHLPCHLTCGKNLCSRTVCKRKVLHGLSLTQVVLDLVVATMRKGSLLSLVVGIEVEKMTATILIRHGAQLRRRRAET